MIASEKREQLIGLTVALLLEVRRSYLAAGASPMKHWDQLQSRMRAAARTCATVPEWSTKLLRDLQIGAPSSSISHSVETLTGAAREAGDAEYLTLLEREHGYVIARARLAAEARKEAREEMAKEWGEEFATDVAPTKRTPTKEKRS